MAWSELPTLLPERWEGINIVGPVLRIPWSCKVCVDLYSANGTSPLTVLERTNGIPYMLYILAGISSGSAGAGRTYCLLKVGVPGFYRSQSSCLAGETRGAKPILSPGPTLNPSIHQLFLPPIVRHQKRVQGGGLWTAPNLGNFNRAFYSASGLEPSASPGTLPPMVQPSALSSTAPLLHTLASNMRVSLPGCAVS